MKRMYMTVTINKFFVKERMVLDKNNVMMIVIIALLVILLGTIGFMSVYLIGFFKNPDEARTTEVDDVEQGQLSQDQLLSVAYADAVKGTIPGDDGSTHAVTFKVSIAVNNSHKGGEKQAAAMEALLSEREAVAKSIISDILYNHTYAEYAETDTIKAALSEEIRHRLALEFGTDLIYRVYLSDYLYQ
jgi:flagellar basal body-associated protein FliL